MEARQRDYAPLLDIADQLARYQRYLGPAEEERAAWLEGQFNSERRKLVFGLLKDEPPLVVLLNSVDGDLQRLSASGEFSDYAIDRVREELHKYLTKEAGKPLLVRFALRWGPPILALAVVVAIMLVKHRLIWGRWFWHP